MKRILIYAVLVMLLAIIVQPCFAIGLSPAKKTLELSFENSVGNGEVRVLNNERKEMRVVIQAQGYLSEYLVIDKKDFVMGPEEPETYVNYRISMSDIPPSEIRNTKISIYVVEIPLSVSFSGSGASASTAAIQKLEIIFPFEAPARTGQNVTAEQQETAQAGDAYTEESQTADYVPLEESAEEIAPADAEELSHKSSISPFVYIVIALIAINLIWIFFIFRKKEHGNV